MKFYEKKNDSFCPTEKSSGALIEIFFDGSLVMQIVHKGTIVTAGGRKLAIK